MLQKLRQLRRKLERNLWGKDPDYEDPFDDPAEQLYARIYLKYLFEKMDAAFRHQRVRILDVGCHTGRLSLPLARAGHEVTAIDTSRFHLKRAEARARAEGLNLRFVRADAFRRARWIKPESFDLVLCTEVLYQRPDFRECLKILAGWARPEGLVSTSHRTRFFYLTQAIRERDFETARFIQTHSEGTLWNSYFNWQTPAELRVLYEEVGLDLLLTRPVGVFTGNGGDGMAALCDLGTLEAAEREALFEIEAEDSEEFAALGRYLLLIGQKKGFPSP